MKKTMKQLERENKRLNQIVSNFLSEANLFVMVLNQIDAAGNLENKELRKVAEDIVAQALERRKAQSLKVSMSLFGCPIVEERKS